MQEEEERGKEEERGFLQSTPAAFFFPLRDLEARSLARVTGSFSLKMDAAAAAAAATGGNRAAAGSAAPAQHRQQQQASGPTANAPPSTTTTTAGAAATAKPTTSTSSPTPFQSKRSRPWPLLTASQLADDTPSRRAGIPAKRERAFYRNLYSLIREGGQALALAQQTTTTALLFGFRYFALRSFSKSDRFVVGAAALFLAAKARDELRPLDAVVTACLKVREAQGGGGGGKKGKKGGGSGGGGNNAEGAGSVAASPLYSTPTPTPGHASSSSTTTTTTTTLPSPASRTAAAISAASLSGSGSGPAPPSTLSAQLADKAFMSSLKEAVLTAERALLYALGFELDLELPHDALMASLAFLRKSESAEVAEFWADPKHTQVALSFINDSFRTSLCLMHDWAHVGVGALVAVVDKLGGPPPVVSLGGGGGSGGSGSGGGDDDSSKKKKKQPRYFWELVPSCSDLTPELLNDVVRIISGMYETAPPAANADNAPAGAAAGASRKRGAEEGGEEDGQGDDGGGGNEGGDKKKRSRTEEGAAGPSSAVSAPANVVKQGQCCSRGCARKRKRSRRRKQKRKSRRRRSFASVSCPSR